MTLPSWDSDFLEPLIEMKTTVQRSVTSCTNISNVMLNVVKLPI